MFTRLMAALSMLVIFSAHVWAEEKGSIELKSVAEVEIVVKNDKGEKEVKKVDAAKAKVVPGDIVTFTTYYTNIGKEPAAAVVVTNPIPEHMLYGDGTAEGKGSKIEFSVDGGKSYGPAQRLKVIDSKGKERAAGASDYSHIRWTLIKPLVAGGKGSVSFKALLK